MKPSVPPPAMHGQLCSTCDRQAAVQGLQRLRGLEPAAVGGFLLRTAAVVCLQSMLPPPLAWCLDASLVLLPMPDLIARCRVGLPTPSAATMCPLCSHSHARCRPALSS